MPSTNLLQYFLDKHPSSNTQTKTKTKGPLKVHTHRGQKTWWSSLKNKQKQTKKPTYGQVPQGRVKINEVNCRYWEIHERNSVAPEGLTVSLHICESRCSCLLNAKFYTARYKKFFSKCYFYRKYYDKEYFSFCSFMLTSPSRRTRSQE